MRKILLALLALLMPSLAHAEDWRVIDANDDATILFMVDADSLVPGQQEERTARLFTVWAEGSPGGYVAMQGDMTFDCVGNRKRVMRIMVYDATGAVVDTAGAQNWDGIIPGSYYAKAAAIVCGQTPPPEESLGAGVPIAEARAALDRRRAGN